MYVAHKKSLKKICRIFLCILGASCLLLTIGWYSFTHYVNAWQRIDTPECHPDWSTEHRTALIELDHKLRSDKQVAGLALMRTVDEEKIQIKKWYSFITVPIATLQAWRDMAAPARAALHEVMRSGKGDICTTEGLPVAQLALKAHHLELAKELIRRRANPNKPYISWAPLSISDDPRLTLMGDVLDGFSYLHNSLETHLSKEEKADLLRLLDEHGGDIRQAPNQRLILLLAAASVTSDEGYGLAWALRHGATCEPESLKGIADHLQREGYHTLLNELRQEGHLPLPDKDSKPTEPTLLNDK